MVLKFLFDRIVALIGIIMLTPVWIIIAVLMKIQMPGPLLFKQKRVGKDGKLFTMYKFRSMRVGSKGTTVSVRGDNRITPLGATLRKYKLDELPELWNVLIGDMSFVGPRPDVPGYADKLEGEDRLILTFRPGITGLASLKYKDEESLLAAQENPEEYNDTVLYPDKVRVNKEYIQNWSFWFDIKLIFWTLFSNKMPQSIFKNEKE